MFDRRFEFNFPSREEWKDKEIIVHGLLMDPKLKKEPALAGDSFCYSVENMVTVCHSEVQDILVCAEKKHTK